MTRRATLDDLPDVIERLMRFHAYSPYRTVPVDPEALEAFAAHCITEGAIFLTETGLCGGLLIPAYFNPSVLTAGELFWYAPDGGGRALREAFEAWAEENGCWAVQFSALQDDHFPKVAANYERNGYRAAEVAFVKEL